MSWGGVWNAAKGAVTRPVTGAITTAKALASGDVGGALKSIGGDLVSGLPGVSQYNNYKDYNSAPPPPDMGQPTVAGPMMTVSRAPTPVTAPPPAAPAAPGLLDTPGVGEDWWAKNGGKFTQPTNSQNYHTQNQGYFSQPPPKPTASTPAYDEYMKTMSDPGMGTNRAYKVSGQLGETTGGEKMMSDFGLELKAPGTGEQYYGDTKDFYGKPGVGENYIDENIGYYGAPGEGETNLQNVDESLGGINFGLDAIDMVNGVGAGANRLNNEYERNGKFFDANPVQDEYDFFSGGLRGPSYSEQFYDGGQGQSGVDMAFDRERMKSQRALDDAMSARGLFGGEASLRGSIDLNQDIAARKALSMADLAKQADAARIARTGAAQTFSTAADNSGFQRRKLGIDTADKADAGDRAMAGISLDAYGLASGESLSKIDKRTTAAGMAQDFGLRRTGEGIDKSVKQQDLETERVKNGQGAADGAENLMLDRVEAGADIGKDLADTEIDRLTTSGTMGLSADTEDRARKQGLLNAGFGMDAANLDFERFGLDKVESGGTMANNADNTNLSFITGGAVGATTTQNLFEGRERGALNDISNVTSQVGGTYEEQATAMANEWMAKEEAKIQAMLDGGQINMDKAQQMRDEARANAATYTKILLEGAKSYGQSQAPAGGA